MSNTDPRDITTWTGPKVDARERCAGCERKFIRAALAGGLCPTCRHDADAPADSRPVFVEYDISESVAARLARGRKGRTPGSKNLPQPERHCQAPGCGELFTPTRVSQLYHSAACKQRAWRAAHGANTRTRVRFDDRDGS